MATVTIELLRQVGLTTIFGNPGSTELPMFRGFPADFRYVLALQESVAVGVADGYAQATHRAAVVNLHSAAGVGHAMGAIFTAYRNRSPLVIVAGQQARSMLAGEPYLYSDQAAELPRPYVKWSREPARPADVPAAIARAYYIATTPPCGPAYVSVPADDWDQPAEPWPIRVVDGVHTGNPDRIAAVAHALAAAERPAFVAGAGIDQAEAMADMVALAQAHRAHVWAPPMSSRCSFPESHPLFAGFLPPTRSGLAKQLHGCDVIVVVGAPAFTYHVAEDGPYLPAGAALFQLVDDPYQAAWSPVGTAVITAIRPCLRLLLSLAAPAERPDPPARSRPRRVPVGDHITPELLVQTVADLRPRDSIIVEEAPSTRPIMCERLPLDLPHSFYTTASGALGHGLPAAVGVALAVPERRVIAFVGDGSFMYSPQALWTAARLGVPLTVIVVNNGRYATVERFADRLGMAPVGTRLDGLDFAAMANAQGGAGMRVTEPRQLPSALERALTAPGVHVVDVVVRD